LNQLNRQAENEASQGHAADGLLYVRLVQCSGQANAQGYKDYNIANYVNEQKPD
jgi:hypothetical protein